MECEQANELRLKSTKPKRLMGQFYIVLRLFLAGGGGGGGIIPVPLLWHLLTGAKTNTGRLVWVPFFPSNALFLTQRSWISGHLSHITVL